MTGLRFDADTMPWVDRQEFDEEAARREAAGLLDSQEVERLRGWRRDGFLLLEGAVEAALIDELLAAYERAWRARLAVQVLVEGRGVVPLRELDRASLDHHHFRFLELHEADDTFRRVACHPTIVRQLRQIFDDQPVIMQSLFFEYGSEQRAHQDFPYVQARTLSHLVGCWIACDDVDEGNGPLFYYRGSHRLPLYDWGEGRLVTDGQDPAAVEVFEERLDTACRDAGLERLTLRARKGDVLLWHAALAHGGAAVVDRERTRRSLVAHFSSVTGYPRDRRWPGADPRRLQVNGALLYQAPKVGAWPRLEAVARRMLRPFRPSGGPRRRQP